MWKNRIMCWNWIVELKLLALVWVCCDHLSSSPLVRLNCVRPEWRRSTCQEIQMMTRRCVTWRAYNQYLLPLLSTHRSKDQHTCSLSPATRRSVSLQLILYWVFHFHFLLSIFSLHCCLCRLKCTVNALRHLFVNILWKYVTKYYCNLVYSY